MFELILALGVLQHISDDLAVLTHIKAHLAPDGLVVLSLRNPLFGLVTFNRPSYELFGELFQESLQSPEGPILDEFLKAKLDLSLPPIRSSGENDPQLDDVVYRFHNPLTVEDLLAQADLKPVHTDFYRHHAMPPMLEHSAPERFKDLSLEQDMRPNDWRSMFLCSTYLLYAGHA
jgi:SAM-dependent methyltransferase